MEKRKIDRINELARKAKTNVLTEDELTEREVLRNEYRAEFRKSLEQTLENCVIVDEDGNERKISKKAE